MPARIVAAMLILFPLSSPAAWDQMNGPVPAVATHLAVHDGAIFLGEDETDAGDVFLSTDGGFQWRTARLHNAGTTAVLSHPSGFYAGTYIEGLYRTTDLGSTWTQVTGFQSAGDHQIGLSASALPSGTYFYRLWRAGEGADGAGQVGTGRIAVIR